ncbi:SDR family NAD(P)-dependent oxidoreductase [Lysinibacillus sp. NPDC094177]|uniref:SDR family NAD(P)-dependent oxidoreductase n=1 Tax=Lysinibacillus sp. NPDC094177 TaxID=3390580 RepID=UPI003CFE25AC
MTNLFDLSGKTIIVTGGSSGIGISMVHALADYGANVIIASRNVERCNNVLKEIESKGGKGAVVQLDISDEKSVENLVKEVLDRFGTIDVLINNAGISPFMAPIEKVKIAGFKKILDVNLIGALQCVQAVSEYMIERKKGKIINISSSASKVSVEGLGAYSITKAALNSLTKTLAFEWGKYNINVNAIAPGFMDTGVANLITDSENILKPVLDRTPMGRTGKAEELKGSVVFLASDASNYLTGQTLYIDGGAGNC